MKLFKSKPVSAGSSASDLNSVRDTSWKRITLDPFVDWMFMLLVGLAVVAVMLVIGVSAYINVGQVTSLVPDELPLTPHLPINANKLGQVAGRINDIANMNFVVPGDPSL